MMRRQGKSADHPFYVKGRGFVKAGELWAGALLLDVRGNLLRLEDMRQELVVGFVTVYNLKVEGFHTYYAGALSVLVHNANYPEDVNGMRERSQAGQEAEQKPVEGGSNAGLAQYGDDLVKMGTYVKNPNINVDWSQYAEHGFECMQINKAPLICGACCSVYLTFMVIVCARRSAFCPAALRPQIL